MIEKLDAVMSVMEAAFDKRWGEAWNRAQVLGSLQMPHTHLLLVDEHGHDWVPGAKAAGFLLSRQAPGEEELLLVAVRPEFRGRKLATKMMQRFRTQAQDRGAERLFLEMRTNNPAEQLYRSQGFTPIGKRKNYYRLADGARLDAITFGISLGSVAKKN